MSSTPREIGTLIVVILKAKNLPNKRHIGKQDPYCCVSMNGEKRRTKAVKRGGQHPEWDEEVRFTLHEDVEDELARTANGNDTPPPPPPKDDKAPKKIKGGKTMRLICYADDPREPDMIGETNVDLTEVLTKGETDEWFTLMNEDKYCGEVYLELTFWSNERPPEKKVTPKPPKSNKQYGGPGSFAPLPSGEHSPSSINGHSVQSSRIASTSSIHEPYSRNESVPSSLRASSSLAKLDLYVPPYERNSRLSSVDQMADDFGELGISGHRRRESFPPPHGGYTPRPQSTVGFSAIPTHPSHVLDEGSYSDVGSIYNYDQPVVPTGPPQHRNMISGPHQPYGTQPNYQNQYDTGSPTAYGLNQSPTRRPRYSIPTSSSGFVPLPNPQSSGFVALTSQQPEPSRFASPQSHTPAPLSYNPSHFTQSAFSPIPSQTPTQATYMPPLPPPSAASFHQQSYSPSHSYQYTAYTPAPATPAPPQHFMSSQPSPTGPPVTHSVPQQAYPGYAPPTPPRRTPPPPPLPQSNSLSSSFGTSSRPLPQPQGYGQPPPQQQQPHQPPYPLQHQLGAYSPNQSGTGIFLGGSALPPPPPPPHVPPNTNPQSYLITSQQPNLPPPPPPPPPPPSQFHTTSSTGRPNLPQPPVDYQQQQQQLPIPPPPPPDFYSSDPPHLNPQPYVHTVPPPPPPPPQLANGSHLYYPGPPEAQWLPPNGSQQPVGEYMQPGWN